MTLSKIGPATAGPRRGGWVAGVREDAKIFLQKDMLLDRQTSRKMLNLELLIEDRKSVV